MNQEKKPSRRACYNFQNRQDKEKSDLPIPAATHWMKNIAMIQPQTMPGVPE